MKIRVGFGYDVHQLREGEEFWLGGIKIDHEKGAVVHSDADVLIHAICDALLGAAALGDIGTHFPDTDRRTKYVEAKGLLYIGTGVSGGEEGALKGPSIMPGGSPKAWEYVKPIFQKIAATVEDGTPCCD